MIHQFLVWIKCWTVWYIERYVNTDGSYKLLKTSKNSPVFSPTLYVYTFTLTQRSRRFRRLNINAYRPIPGTASRFQRIRWQRSGRNNFPLTAVGKDGQNERQAETNELQTLTADEFDSHAGMTCPRRGMKLDVSRCERLINVRVLYC